MKPACEQEHTLGLRSFLHTTSHSTSQIGPTSNHNSPPVFVKTEQKHSHLVFMTWELFIWCGTITFNPQYVIMHESCWSDPETHRSSLPPHILLFSHRLSHTVPNSIHQRAQCRQDPFTHAIKLNAWKHAPPSSCTSTHPTPPTKTLDELCFIVAALFSHAVVQCFLKVFQIIDKSDTQG